MCYIIYKVKFNNYLCVNHIDNQQCSGKTLQIQGVHFPFPNMLSKQYLTLASTQEGATFNIDHLQYSNYSGSSQVPLFLFFLGFYSSSLYSSEYSSL